MTDQSENGAPEADVETDAGETPGEPKKRLREADWAEAKALYETGKATKQDLVDRYGISRQAITKGLAARGAVYGSRAKEVEDAAAERQKDDAAKRVEEIKAFKTKQQKMVEMLQNLTVKVITEQVRDNKPISDKRLDIAALNKAMQTLAIGRGELYHIYDLNRDPDQDSETEEFIISEYSQDEIDALNKQRLGIDPDATLDEVARALEEPVDDDLDDLLGGT